ncbi:oxamate amidohydrolase proenzyme-like [Galleria mellonella]|uniref:Oxamate amidohydrolase proenzyme-like n=1 Tax=Galleria mellonella TaxID=7137 RepID=A0A6J3C3P5_GALME|nr:oxamate amidohydrolase proenzyme-like [Galleria mellonella]XP_031766450.1 oxamate amidohydrolase proenzyme-like [Galleria mellonella]XP_052759241.1 oxamate amidohydrolase proenzyme-like [Galleria mellonella]
MYKCNPIDYSTIATRCMVVTPHHLATESALAILREGGTAIEAMVAAAATIAVVYPHMNSIGGDSFWLIVPPSGEPIVIEASGAAGSSATEEFYKNYKSIPQRGPKSALTVAGTVGGWQEALNYISEIGYQTISTPRLLADAIHYAENGFPVSSSHAIALSEFIEVNNASEEFKNIYLPNGKVPNVGEMFYQKNLATTLRHLAENGLNSFYQGNLANIISEEMKAVGMPITKEDLRNYTPIRKKSLQLPLKYGVLFNTPPPTVGVVSLSILGLLEKLNINGQHEGKFIHAAIESTKQAFIIRDKFITDPLHMKTNPESLLTPEAISRMANNINLERASNINNGKGPGDTVWMAAMDDEGFSVSFIQSVYHDFGSGVILPKTGILWHNRGVSFNLDKDSLLYLSPGKKPIHTLNPAAARLNDGRLIVYGTRGGDGQPQTQAALFHRYVVQGLNLQKAVSTPRWVYGDTLQKHVTTVKIEDRFDEDTIKYLKNKGHVIELLPPFSEKFGHAGAIVRHPDGRLEGAYDPRSNGNAAGF